MAGTVSRREQAQLELALERPEAALACLESEGPDALRVEALARLRRLDAAQQELARLPAGAAAERARALLAEDFATHFRAALAAEDDPFEHARTRLLFGERLRRAGRRVDAREQLRAAWEALEQLGAQPWADRAKRELDATAEHTRADASSDALTKQEAEVARVVAAGATNREAAARLFLSEKTIEFHLRNVFRKLGVRSRTELATQLAAPEVAPPPRKRGELIGRDDDLAALRELVQRERLVTLTGPGGAGKTALARALADERADAVFVDLSAVRDPALIVWAIAQALGVRQAGAQPLADAVNDELGTRERLLVLDNFEHVLDAAVVVAEVLAAAASAHVLVTSRAPLRLAAEAEFAVAPLAVEPAEELFVTRARAVDPDFAPRETSTIAAICRRLDGLPLAIELAAARTTLLPPEQILARLDRRLALLTRGARDVPARQQTLRGAIDWSYELLDDGEQALFARLAVFVGGFEAVAAEAVAGASLDTLDSLLDKSLLVRASDSGAPRLTMLETIREYAQERFDELDERDAIRRAHLEYFLALAEQHGDAVERGEAGVWRAVMQREYANVRNALECAFAAGDVDATLRLAAPLGFYWRSRGDVREGRRWLEAVMERFADADHASLPYVVFTAASAAGLDGDDALRVQRWERALELFRAHGNLLWVARTNELLCRAYSHAGEQEAALRAAEEAIGIARRLDSGPEVARALNELAELRVRAGDPAAALPMLDEAIELGQAQRGRVLGPVYRCRAQAHLLLGDVDAARADLDEALEIDRSDGHGPPIATECTYRGHVALLDGDVELARALFTEALEVSRGEKWTAKACLHGLAEVALRGGDARRALRLIAAAQPLYVDTAFISALMERWRAVAAQAAEALGAAEAEAARCAGAAMSVEEALAEAVAST